MGVCSYCGEYAQEWEECFGWDQATACSEKARRRYQLTQLPKIKSNGLRLAAKEGHKRVSSVARVRK